MLARLGSAGFKVVNRDGDVVVLQT
jgi:hypothetical protein